MDSSQNNISHPCLNLNLVLSEEDKVELVDHLDISEE